MENKNEVKRKAPISRKQIKDKLDYIIDNFDPHTPVKEQTIKASDYLNAVKQLRELYDIDKKKIVKVPPVSYDVDM